MLTPDEAIRLAPKATALGLEIGRALAPDGDGGKTITPAEGKRLLRLVGELLVALVVDVLD